MKLPPLNALKAFEAAARTGGFVSAALELGVSSAAVSMQVRNLEAFLGKKLFLRANNRITLTDAGRSIFPTTASVMSELSAMTERLLEGASPARLVVSTPPSLAERWLVPKLADFRRLETDLAIDLRIEEDPIDLPRQHVDVRIAYGSELYPEYRVRKLFQDRILPVHAPGFAASFGGTDDLALIPDEYLIHTEWGPEFGSYPRWSDWFEAAGIARRPLPGTGLRTDTMSIALTMAARGMGVALGHQSVAAGDLISGVLIAPSPIALELGNQHYAITTHAKAGDRIIESFVDLLVEDMT